LIWIKAIYIEIYNKRYKYPTIKERGKTITLVRGKTYSKDITNGQ